MKTPARTDMPSGPTVEFADRLRGYRFATELRASEGTPGVRVWHTHDRVIVGLSSRRPSAASLAMIQAASEVAVQPEMTRNLEAPGVLVA
jgi:hypothetical protein